MSQIVERQLLLDATIRRLPIAPARDAKTADAPLPPPTDPMDMPLRREPDRDATPAGGTPDACRPGRSPTHASRK
jgi:hypothetical protein